MTIDSARKTELRSVISIESLHPRRGKTLDSVKGDSLPSAAVNARMPMNAADSRFPLGKPINRRTPQPLRPIPGRPNWFVDSRGIERYLEVPATQVKSPRPSQGRGTMAARCASSC